ncbi:Glycosyl transferase family 2 [Raineyella antarctica]|uniref:Glycosyl transferase family 2 n=1 Tax=Raineyella antarctica TaxID=1577474 RepID=A0A1G6HGY3_9ACTN|nr:glycosyltransferase family A protein [Raineyella antarctica]SDB93434.1 Glycosyl transferase family 2 [Raineyella antarctica]
MRHDSSISLAAPITVSVVIPCYNYARFLPEAVESAVSQQGVDVEVIIVDDASTDDSLLVARRLAAIDTRVTVVGHDRNRGPVVAFNDGLARATGEFLVRLDADDMLTPGSLSRAVGAATSRPRVGLVYGHPLHFHAENLPVPRTRMRGVTVWDGRRWLVDRCRDGANVITSPEVVMRTSVVRRVGGQAPLAHSHDMEHWLRIASVSQVAYLRGVDQAWHREHSASLSAREVSGVLDLEQRLEAFETLLKPRLSPRHDVRSPAPQPIAGADTLLARARDTIAELALMAATHALDANLPIESEYRPFRDLALRISPDLESSRRLRWLDGRAAGTRSSNPMSRLVRRSRLALRHRLRTWRWERTGVY